MDSTRTSAGPWIGVVLLAGSMLTGGCDRSDANGVLPETAHAGHGPVAQARDSRLREREALVQELEEQGITRADVLKAMRAIPRHEFVPEPLQPLAYANRPLPIGNDQTISQPYIVALMTELAQIDDGDKVLEIGTGSGYQAAVLSVLAKEVYTIEIVEPLARQARASLERLELADNVHFRVGDGYAGWPDAAPFDAIVVTAAPPEVPQPLKQQLAPGGRLIIPVGEAYQQLRVIERTADGFEQQQSIPVRFVPMTGRASEG